jgi:hypothetical protein
MYLGVDKIATVTGPSAKIAKPICSHKTNRSVNDMARS